MDKAILEVLAPCENGVNCGEGKLLVPLAIPNVAPESETYEHPNVTTEQDVLEVTITDRTKINNIYLDLVNLTKNCTVRVKAKIDGTNYREIDSLYWTTADRDGIIISEIVSDVDVKVTIQSAEAEGASRNIPYRVV